MSDIETLQAAYASFNKGDVGKVLDVLDKRIEWHGPDVRSLPGAGIHRGPKEVADEFFKPVGEAWESFEIDAREYVEGEKSIVVLGKMEVKGRESGRAAKLDFAHAWKFRDGKAVRFQAYVDTAGAMNALFDPDNTGYPRRG